MMRKSAFGLAFLLAFTMILFGCGTESQTGTNPADYFADESQSIEAGAGTLTLLFTGNLQCGYAPDENTGVIGYEALAAYAKDLEEDGQVVLLDGGDSLSGAALSWLSQGKLPMELLNGVGLDFALPGDRDVAYGQGLLESADFSWLNGPADYEILDFEGVKVAFLGIPKAAADYEAIQAAIDTAKKEGGAKYVIAVAHVGMDPADSPWTAPEIIANTTGLTALLDGHSDFRVTGEMVKDMDDNEVLLCTAGADFVGVTRLSLDLDSGLASAVYETELEGKDEAMADCIEAVEKKLEDLLAENVAVAAQDMVLKNKDGTEFLVQRQETNLGNLCADAFRASTGADVALIPGSAIRGGLDKGTVTCGDILGVLPFGYEVGVAQVTGQEILDALEYAYRNAGEAADAVFFQVSGLRFAVDTQVESTVELDEDDNFLRVAGERRVQEVLVGEEPLDPAKTYTLASTEFLLRYGGHGLGIFQDNTTQSTGLTDQQLLLTFVRDALNGDISEAAYGKTAGRITIK